MDLRHLAGEFAPEGFVLRTAWKGRRLLATRSGRRIFGVVSIDD